MHPMCAGRAVLTPVAHATPRPLFLSASPRHTPSQRHSGQRTRSRYALVCNAALATESLKQELLQALESGEQTLRTGVLTPEVEAIVTRLKAAASEQPPQLQPELLNGTFSGLLNTTNYLAADSSSTLGTLTFQQFAPKDLKVMVSGTEMVSGVESPEHYQTNTYFEVSEGEGTGLAGVQSAIGAYEVDGDKAGRQVVYFKAIKIAPVDSSKDALQRWLDVFKAENPSMGDDGVAVIEFPQRAKGTRDFILLDQDMQVTVGNRGSVVIVKRR
ncbi:hypothetical protein COCOBI_02-8920 [Coccomyxa sp. Obi]|nr:hypothetical protein COCOBI_02-8920 [Coccomyxa sp. Obi]